MTKTIFSQNYVESTLGFLKDKNSLTNFELSVNDKIVRVKVFKIKSHVIINVWNIKLSKILLRYDLVLSESNYVLKKSPFSDANFTLSLANFLSLCENDYSKLHTLSTDELDITHESFILKKNNILL